MGFVWVHVESFLHSVASPVHSFVTTEYILKSHKCAHQSVSDILMINETCLGLSGSGNDGTVVISH